MSGQPEIIRIVTQTTPGIIKITEQGGTAVNNGGTVTINAGTPLPAVAYTHRQGVSADVWRINHALGFYPNITAFDTAGDVIEGEIVHLDTMSLTLIFSVALSGEAYLS